MIDQVLFKDLEACDPVDVVYRTGCSFEASKGIYKIKVWGRSYAVDPAREEIRTVQSESHGEYMHLFLLHYLMRALDISLAEVWVSEKDIPSGAAFFRGPHTLPTHLVVQAFGNNLEKLAVRCEALGGAPLNMADRAFRFEITPRIPVAVLYWQGDEDFPAESRLLFDRTISRHLPLDIVYALAVQVCRTIAGQ